jgi:hypothetical protein
MSAPVETRRLGQICPVCGKPLTVGSCADGACRPAAAGLREDSPGVFSHIPLPEVLGRSRDGTGPKSDGAAGHRFGSEFDLLLHTPLDESVRLPVLGRWSARNGRVLRKPGFDGEYGVIRSRGGRTERLAGQESLFGDGLTIQRTRTKQTGALALPAADDRENARFPGKNRQSQPGAWPPPPPPSIR